MWRMSIKDIFNTSHFKFKFALGRVESYTQINIEDFQAWLASAVTPGCTLHKNTHMGKQYNLLWFILPPLKV